MRESKRRYHDSGRLKSARLCCRGTWLTGLFFKLAMVLKKDKHAGGYGLVKRSRGAQRGQTAGKCD